MHPYVIDRMVKERQEELSRLSQARTAAARRRPAGRGVLASLAARVARSRDREAHGWSPDLGCAGAGGSFDGNSGGE